MGGVGPWASGGHLAALLSRTALAILSCAGCADDTTSVTLIIDAQPTVREGLEDIRVVVYDAEGEPTLDRTFEMLPDQVRRIRVVPRGGDASRPWRIEVEGRDAEGRTFVLTRRSGSYRAGEQREALLCLEATCVERFCAGECTTPDGGTPACTTCDDGRCVSERLDDSALALPGAGPQRCEAEAVCVPTGSERCDDGEDNDCDERVDCDDPDCDGASCDVGTFTCGTDAGGGAACLCNGRTPVTENGPTCTDGIDNDCNGLTDCDDLGCDATDGCNIESRFPNGCGNGMDDDGDGLTDCDDPHCCRVEFPECWHRTYPGADNHACCNGTITPLTQDEHCGACNVACRNSNVCKRTPLGAAWHCDCNQDDRPFPRCPGTQACERPEGGGFQRCVCDANADCRVGPRSDQSQARCLQPANDHGYCDYPP